MQSWDEYVKEAKALPVQKMKDMVFWLSVTWEMDWDFLSDVYSFQGMSPEEIEAKRKEYFDNARKQLQETFGDTGIL